MRKFAYFIGPVVALTCATFSPAAGITMTNPSFEALVLGCAPIGCIAPNAVPGWSQTPGLLFGSTWEPSIGPGNQFPGGIPDGVNIVAVGGPNVLVPTNSGDVNQTVTATLQANTIYTLTAYVGQRSDFPISGYTVSLKANGVTLASDSSLRPGPGAFLADIITFDSGANPIELGQNLTIDLFGTGLNSVGGGGQVVFDNISLQATTNVTTPEPTFLSPLGLVGLGLFRLLRGKRN